MKQNKTIILCFGDSNTYGYDPRSYLGDRYPGNVRWTGLLKEKTGLDIRNAGLPGREIPRFQYEMQQIQDRIRTIPLPLQFLIMLGSNDLLNGGSITARIVADRMKNFLEFLISQDTFRSGNMQILLISPPQMQPGEWTNPHILTESASLGHCLEQIVSDLHPVLTENPALSFADAGSWELPMTFDGVHLTEEGHRRFAEKISLFLPS